VERENKMNKLNYASLEASKKLADAGIVLKTDALWRESINGEETQLLIKDQCTYDYGHYIPAPCFAEIWRELPCNIGTRHGYIMMLSVTKSTDRKTFVCYGNDRGEVWEGEHKNINPCDALVELLIWVRGGNQEAS